MLGQTGPEGAVARVIQGIMSKEIGLAVKQYEPDALKRLPDGRVLKGRPEIERDFIEDARSSSSHITIHDYEVIADDGIAMVMTDYTMVLTPNDEDSVTVLGRTHDVVRRQPDGSWKIAIDHPYEPRQDGS